MGYQWSFGLPVKINSTNENWSQGLPVGVYGNSTEIINVGLTYTIIRTTYPQRIVTDPVNYTIYDWPNDSTLGYSKSLSTFSQDQFYDPISTTPKQIFRLATYGSTDIPNGYAAASCNIDLTDVDSLRFQISGFVYNNIAADNNKVEILIDGTVVWSWETNGTDDGTGYVYYLRTLTTTVVPHIFIDTSAYSGVKSVEFRATVDEHGSSSSYMYISTPVCTPSGISLTYDIILTTIHHTISYKIINSNSISSSLGYDIVVPKVPLKHEYAYVKSSTTSRATTSTSFVDDVDCVQTFTLPEERTVFVTYRGGGGYPTAESIGGHRVNISVDGVDQNEAGNGTIQTDYKVDMMATWVGTLAAGNHTIQGRFASTGAYTTTLAQHVLTVNIFKGNGYITSRTDATYPETDWVSLVGSATVPCKAIYFVSATSNTYTLVDICVTDGDSISFANVLRHDGPGSAPVEKTTCGYCVTDSNNKVRVNVFPFSNNWITISILLVDASTLVDYFEDAITLKTSTSTAGTNDTTALITTSLTDIRSLFVFYQAGNLAYVDTWYGYGYRVKVDAIEYAISYTASGGYGYSRSISGAYGFQTLNPGSHTIQGMVSGAYISDIAGVDSRKLLALWFDTPPYVSQQVAYKIDSIHPVTRDLVYKIFATRAAITTSLQYIIVKRGLVEYLLKYVIVGVEIIEIPLQYVILATPTIEQTCQYAIIKSTKVDQSLEYEIAVGAVSIQVQGSAATTEFEDDFSGGDFSKWDEATVTELETGAATLEIVGEQCHVDVETIDDGDFAGVVLRKTLTVGAWSRIEFSYKVNTAVNPTGACRLTLGDVYIDMDTANIGVWKTGSKTYPEWLAETGSPLTDPDILFEIDAANEATHIDLLIDNVKVYGWQDGFQLGYDIATAVVSATIEQPSEYTVLSTPAATTKSLQYTIVVTPTAGTKSLEYAIGLAITEVVDLKYAIVKTIAATTVGLQYVVLKASSITDSLLYTVKSVVTTTKGLEYVVSGGTTLFNSLQYTVLSTHSALIKNVTYTIGVSRVVQSNAQYVINVLGVVSKTIQYTIKKSTTITDDVKYSVQYSIVSQVQATYEIIRSATISDTLTYTVKISKQISLGMQYAIWSTPSAIIRDVTYTIGVPTVVQNTVQYVINVRTILSEGCQYTIRTSGTIIDSVTYAINKSVVSLVQATYEIIRGNEIQSTLTYTIGVSKISSVNATYVINRITEVTKGLQYYIYATKLITVGLEYQVAGITVVLVTKGLQYTIPKTKVVTDLLQYSISRATTGTKLVSYTIIRSVPINDVVQYTIKVVQLNTKPLQYNISVKLVLNKQISYAVTSTHIVQDILQYMVLKPQLINKGLQYIINVPKVTTTLVTYSVLVSKLITRALEYALHARWTEDVGVTSSIDLDVVATSDIISSVESISNVDRDVTDTSEIDSEIEDISGVKLEVECVSIICLEVVDDSTITMEVEATSTISED